MTIFRFAGREAEYYNRLMLYLNIAFVERHEHERSSVGVDVDVLTTKVVDTGQHALFLATGALVTVRMRQFSAIRSQSEKQDRPYHTHCIMKLQL